MDKSYQPIASDEEHLIPDEPPVQQYLKRELIYSLSRDWKYSQSIAWLCHAIILLVACTLFAFSYFLTYGAPSNATCECRPNPTYCKYSSLRILDPSLSNISHSPRHPNSQVLYNTIQHHAGTGNNRIRRVRS